MIKNYYRKKNTGPTSHTILNEITVFSLQVILWDLWFQIKLIKSFPNIRNLSQSEFVFMGKTILKNIESSFFEKDFKS